MNQFSYEFIEKEIPGFEPEFFDLWLLDVINYYEKENGEITFVFCSDEYLLEMNKEHLDHDYLTDIITFNYNEGIRLSGDIFISLDRVKDNAMEYGDSNFHNELCRVMAHGILHLVGFNDKSENEQAQMTEEENRCLSLRK